MAKLNIRAGDIPETDEEVEQELVKLDRREAQKRGRLAEKKAAQEQEAAANHEPGQPLPEDAAERAASGSGWQGEEIPDVKKKPAPTKKRPLKNKREIAPLVKEPVKKQQPKRETGVSRVNAQVVLTIFELAKKGDDNKAISSATKIPVSYIGPILMAHPDWVKHTQAEFAAIGKQYPEKFVRPKPEKSAAQSGQVQE